MSPRIALKVDDFATKQGGGVFATSVGGALAGRGADLIIFDDPLDLKDAGNIKQVELVNQRFDSLILSRLNDPRTGRIVIIAHRLNDNDLSAHVREQGGWRHVVLPLIATHKKAYDLGYDTWVRRRGELLRPGSYTAKQLTQLVKTTINPDFELFYQQGRGHGARMVIKAEHFALVNPQLLAGSPVILSIDPSQRGGANNSYAVIQAWSPNNGYHVLLEQWREQCNFDQPQKCLLVVRPPFPAKRRAHRNHGERAGPYLRSQTQVNAQGIRNHAGRSIEGGEASATRPADPPIAHSPARSDVACWLHQRAH